MIADELIESTTENENADAQSVRSVSVRSVRSTKDAAEDPPAPAARKTKKSSVSVEVHEPEQQEGAVQISTTDDAYIVKGPAMAEYKHQQVLRPRSVKVC